MLLIGLVNFLKHGIPVQNEQGDVKPGVFHMELSTKYEKKKSWLWQSLIFTENQTIGRIGYKSAEHQLGEGRSFRCAPLPSGPIFGKIVNSKTFPVRINSQDKFFLFTQKDHWMFKGNESKNIELRYYGQTGFGEIDYYFEDGTLNVDA